MYLYSECIIKSWVFCIVWRMVIKGRLIEKIFMNILGINIINVERGFGMFCLVYE